MKRFSVRFLLTKVFLASLCFFLASSAWGQVVDTLEPEKKELLTRGEKTLLLNVGAMAAIAAYGAAKWDYGQDSFNVDNEGWFGMDTKYGGMDKLGHFWSSYALSHLISYAYRKWGYTDEEANLYGVLSNLGIETFMEVADGFSSQGFSYEDIVMNVAGSAVAYIWGKYPSLARKVDFRVEYIPEFDSDDSGFSTNYGNQKYLIAVKADGFDAIKNPYLQYLELRAGYYTRGFEDYEPNGPDHRRRTVFVGLGFNVNKLVKKIWDTRLFDYIQIPYTSINLDFNLH